MAMRAVSVPLLNVTCGATASASATGQVLSGTGCAGCASAGAASSTAISATSPRIGAEIVISIGPALGPPRLDVDGDIGLPADVGADGPEIDLRQGLIGANALAETSGGILHREIIIADRRAKAADGRGDGLAFRNWAQIFQRL